MKRTKWKETTFRSITTSARIIENETRDKIRVVEISLTSKSSSIRSYVLRLGGYANPGGIALIHAQFAAKLPAQLIPSSPVFRRLNDSSLQEATCILAFPTCDVTSGSSVDKIVCANGFFLFPPWGGAIELDSSRPRVWDCVASGINLGLLPFSRGIHGEVNKIVTSGRMIWFSHFWNLSRS